MNSGEHPLRRLSDAVSLGVLARWVPRDAIDMAIAVTGKKAKRKDGKLPPHVMVYFTMAMALFADDDEEVLARLTDTLASWPDCWDTTWEAPGSGGITQARQRLGSEPMKQLFTQVAEPVADMLTPGAFLGTWRLVTIDGMEWDVPDSSENAALFGYAGTGDKRSAFPKVRVVALAECASHAYLAAAIGGGHRQRLG
ncbi:transposase domain-containing protein [Microbispora amethystogenes]|uniref:transposase domain-containing protein n=1 Tax=Microbispora amethystogenes TaxID=1427754 RepID=UPI003F4CF222